MLFKAIFFLFLSFPITYAMAITPFQLNETVNTFTVINNNDYDAMYYINAKTLQVEPEKAFIRKGEFQRFKIIKGKTERFTVDEKAGSVINAIELEYTQKSLINPLYIILGCMALMGIMFIKRTFLKRKEWSILRRLKKNGRSAG